MAGNYEKGLYNQLMEVMARLEKVERESSHKISKLNSIGKVRLHSKLFLFSFHSKNADFLLQLHNLF